MKMKTVKQQPKIPQTNPNPQIRKMFHVKQGKENQILFNLYIAIYRKWCYNRKANPRKGDQLWEKRLQ